MEIQYGGLAAFLPRLRVLLHEGGHTLHQLRHRNRLLVGQVVGLGNLSGLLDQQAVVRTHSRVNHADVLVDHLHAMHAVLLIEWRLVFVLCGNDDAVGSCVQMGSIN